jgi:hypothetical protein
VAIMFPTLGHCIVTDQIGILIGAETDFANAT